MIELIFALAVLGVLSGGFLLVLKKLGLLSSPILLLFAITLFIHLGATLFIHYAEFYPFGGGMGDQLLYHDSAIVIADDFQQGIFSIEHIQEALSLHRMKQGYPVLLGIVYAFTVPAVIVGKMLSVWFACVAVVFLFLIARELGISVKGAFVVGFMGSVYPSFLYFGSLLLRESAVVALLLLVFLLLLKLIKAFSWEKFFFLYVTLLLLVHLRFYVGLALVLAVALVALLCLPLSLEKRLREALLVILLLGFIPQTFGYGYYGMEILADFLHPQKIEGYRERAYVPQGILQAENSFNESESDEQKREEKSGSDSTVISDEQKQEEKSGSDSTVIVEVDTENPLVFMRQNLVSFSYVTLGPFPWHITHDRQLFALGETIPWFILFLFAVLGGFSMVSRKWRLLIPFVLAVFGLLVMISLFIDNFGVYMRIRMPAFMLLLALVPLGFSSLQQLTKRRFFAMLKDSKGAIL